MAPTCLMQVLGGFLANGQGGSALQRRLGNAAKRFAMCREHLIRQAAMIDRHFFRSIEKLELVVASMRARASSPSITRPAQGVELQPFCGALTRMSTPSAFMSTHIAPEATQSSTSMPPCPCTASASARR